MKPWIVVLAAVLPAATIILLSLLFYWRRRRRQQEQQQLSAVSSANSSFNETAAKSRHDGIQAGIAKLHLSHKSTSSKSSLRFHQLHSHQNHQNPQHRQPPRPFDWDDHPRLVAEAVESGWARFAFAAPSSAAPRLPSPLLAHFCAACDAGHEPEISWEVPAGSSEFMQTVRLNPKKSGGGGSKNASPLHGDESSYYCSIRMSLPLPGPPLGASSFPQEAYFEITILYLQPVHHKSSRASKRDGSGGGDSDKARLFRESSVEDHSKGFIHSVNGTRSEPKFTKEEDKKHSNLVLSLGLTVGGPPPSRSTPGTYPGSIAFNSNGSVLLDGMKLVFESEKTEWAGVNRVIGCGFNPGNKKVFLTVDSELVHVIHCNSDAYRRPLYPVLAANADVLVLVNMGQSAFRYAPANAQRTPNPCFLRPSPNNIAGGVIDYEDSRELFSMGRIDSGWMREAGKSKSHSTDGDERSILDAESELFEIALHS